MNARVIWYDSLAHHFAQGRPKATLFSLCGSKKNWIILLLWYAMISATIYIWYDRRSHDLLWPLLSAIPGFPLILLVLFTCFPPSITVCQSGVIIRLSNPRTFRWRDISRFSVEFDPKRRKRILYFEADSFADCFVIPDRIEAPSITDFYDRWKSVNTH